MLFSPLIPVLLLAPFLNATSLPTHTSLRQGHTYYPCTNSSQCIASLQCTDGRSPNCPSPPCHCLPASNRVRLCLTSDECPSGEICATSTSFDNPFCIDAQLVAAVPMLQPQSSPSSSPTPSGLSYDLCHDDAACAAGYVCMVDGEMQCVLGSVCRCFPPEGPQGCERRCRRGELCAQGSFIRLPMCVSETVVRAEGNITAVRDGPLSSERPRPAGSGVAFDECQTDVECRMPRRCFQDPETLCMSETGVPCTCQYLEGVRRCDGARDCGEGEGCFGGPNEAARYVCVSTDLASRLKDLTEKVEASMEVESMEATVESEGFCIDVELLEGWDGSELVFERDVKANVLCDGRRSCATSGHMVIWNGRVMRMGRYCEEVRCEKRVVRVNSPRWRRGRRVKSRTEGLEFTSFAARMNTKAEEVLLGLIVRIGL